MSTLNQLIATGGVTHPEPPFNFLEAQERGLRNELLRKQIGSYDKAEAWQQKEREMQGQKFQWMTADRVKELENQPIKDDIEKVKFLYTIAPLINFQNYAQSRDWLINRNKIPSHILPEPQQFVDEAQKTGKQPEEVFKQWGDNSLRTMDQRLREELGMARLESAERLTGARIDSAEKVAGIRQDAYKDRQDLLFKHQTDTENLRAQHRKELEETKGTAREGRDLTSKQREARITIESLYNMNKLSGVDEATSDKAGMAMEEASKMLDENPDLDAQTAASRSKRSVDRKWKAIDNIPILEKPGFMSKGNKDKTRKSVREALDSGVDTKSILQKLIEKGWSQLDAITEIRNAASIQ